MTTLGDVARKMKTPRLPYLIGLGLALLFAAIGISNRKHPQASADPQSLAQLQSQVDEANVRAYSAAPRLGLASFAQKEEMLFPPQGVKEGAPYAAERRIVRTASIEMVVQNPADAAQEITELAEKLGGFLVNAKGGGRSATLGSLVIRVPVAQFEEARAEIRKLGLRVESDSFEAKDVTQEYVDQEATIRNLRAEEAQYLSILQQSHTVNDMFVVSQKLTEVRGLIEKQEAQFNAMWHQTETVVIAISLRTDSDEKVFGVNWHPLYQLKLASADALAELVNYGMVMATILLYVPAVLLWAGTLFLAVVLGWRTVRWIRRRWSQWTAVQHPVQG